MAWPMVLVVRAAPSGAAEPAMLPGWLGAARCCEGVWWLGRRPGQPGLGRSEEEGQKAGGALGAAAADRPVGHVGPGHAGQAGCEWEWVPGQLEGVARAAVEGAGQEPAGCASVQQVLPGLEAG